ncbi:MAG: cyclodeaminase/cyclohydrolase family protein [Ruminococcaceae bacterium]|nr:cyclodeaminase/cyclohydrolase family protein [Oscillospiraceae bacterium]
MMELKNLTVAEFSALTASNAPAPGGGSVSALVGNLSAALAQMVANLTVGREKYAAAQEDMQALLSQVPAIYEALLAAVDEDSRAFDRYMAALSMPKTTDEEKKLRLDAMQEGLKEASLVPLGVAQTALKLFAYLEKALTVGNPNAVTDAMVGVMLARTCVLGAIFNVRVNLSSIRDEEFVSETAKRCDELQQLAAQEEIRLLKSIPISGM